MAIRKRTTVIVVAIVALAGTYALCIWQDRKSSGFRIETDLPAGMSVNFVGVQPDGGDEVFDECGNLVGKRDSLPWAKGYWNSDQMSLDFVFEFRGADEPIVGLEGIRLTANRARPDCRERSLVISHAENGTVITVRTRPECKWVESHDLGIPFVPKRWVQWTAREELERLDVELQFITTEPRDGDIVFSGPMVCGKPVRANGGGTTCALTRETYRGLVNGPALEFVVKGISHGDHRHCVVRDQKGRCWALYRKTDREGEFICYGVDAASIAAFEVRRPYSIALRNVDVRYPGLTRRYHAKFQDELAARLGARGGYRSEEIKEPNDLLNVIDVYEAYAAGCVNSDAISKLSTVDDTSREKVLAVAQKWMDDANSVRYWTGVRLGVAVGDSRAVDAAIEMLSQTYWERWRHKYGTGAEAYDCTVPWDVRTVARSLYELKPLNDEQRRKLSEVIEHTDDGEVRWLLMSPMGTPECIRLAADDRPYIWWPAARKLTRYSMQPYSDVSAKVKERAAAATGEIPDEETRQAARKVLSEILTPEMSRMAQFSVIEICDRVNGEFDAKTAGQMMLRYLAAVVSDPRVDEWWGQAYYSQGECNQIMYVVRNVNRIYGANIAGVGSAQWGPWENYKGRLGDMRDEVNRLAAEAGLEVPAATVCGGGK